MTETLRLPTPRLEPGHLYVGDNGECFCFDHAGRTAQYAGVGRDGFPLLDVTGEGETCDTCEYERSRAK